MAARMRPRWCVVVDGEGVHDTYIGYVSKRAAIADVPAVAAQYEGLDVTVEAMAVLISPTNDPKE